MKNLSVSQRSQLVAEKLKIKLENIANFSLDPNQIMGRNCENMIGVTQIPLGIAGPIAVKLPAREYYLPLATTEGALIASVNRGCKATRLSGGIRVKVELKGVTRAPVFKVNNLAEAEKLITWIKKNFNQLKQQVEATSRYLKLLDIEPFITGKNLFLRFSYDTAEAMGMNMATIATQQAVSLIELKLKVKCVSLSGNFCVDKKASWLNFIQGRGKCVWAEARLKKAVVKQVLKTTPEKIVEVVLRKDFVGSAMSGSLGFNGHFANIVAALFLATGQDMAHVVEGSLGITTAELETNGDLYFSVYLPSLMLGTVGGGTGLATQKEALAILGLGQGKKGEALELAVIVGAAVLAGELSLTAALAAGHLVKAHEKLGRGSK
ncbi:hydroxymethylglutaryl-CoA reductase (NADPH) [Patescibacteria group bacterium]|nr:hydroxymethylglutaryl-CoA reductase (NADPH) [Patescibacteria group bacterium]MBU1931489.1 hydroxymethylglutaryl-CoA reductase (NADPH) [Patescibacteria group bacterium]